MLILTLCFVGMALLAIALYASAQIATAHQAGNGPQLEEDGGAPPYKALLLLSLLGFAALIQLVWLLPTFLAD